MRRQIATIPIDGDPDTGTLQDIETIYTMGGWQNVGAVAQPVNASADIMVWEAKVFADERHCDQCGGTLIGSEVAWGTCGHCGRRSLTPNPQPAATAPLTVREGLLAVAGGLVVGILTGLALMAATGLGVWAGRLAGWAGGWPQLTLWAGTLGAAVTLVWAVADPKVVRR